MEKVHDKQTDRHINRRRKPNSRNYEPTAWVKTIEIGQLLIY